MNAAVSQEAIMVRSIGLDRYRILLRDILAPMQASDQQVSESEQSWRT